MWDIGASGNDSPQGMGFLQTMLFSARDSETEGLLKKLHVWSSTDSRSSLQAAGDNLVDLLQRDGSARALARVPAPLLSALVRSPQQHALVAQLLLHPRGASLAARARAKHGTQESLWLRNLVRDNLQVLAELPPAQATALRAALRSGIAPARLPVDPYGLLNATLPPAPALPPVADYAAFFAMHDMSGGAHLAAGCAPGPGPIPMLMHAIWLGGMLPKAYHKRLSSHAQHNPQYTRVLWTDWPRADLRAHPKGRRLLHFCGQTGLRLLSVQEVALPLLRAQGLHTAYAQRVLHRQYGGASDILRVGLLRAFGGLYSDADRTCVRPLAELHTHRLVLYGERGVGVFCNDFMLSTPRHPFMARLALAIRHAKPWEAAPWAFYPRAHAAVITTTGPSMVHREYIAWGPRPEDNVRLLGKDHLGGRRGKLSLSVRSNALTWLQPPHASPANDSESAVQRVQRQITCVLDNWRNLASLSVEARKPERLLILQGAANLLISASAAT